MTKRPLRWIFLLPVVLTIAIGFTVFAVYVDRVERSNRLADIDAELVRADAGNRLAAGPDRGAPPPSGDAAPNTDNPVQLLIDSEGIVVAANFESPLSDATLARLAGNSGFATVSDENYRVRLRRTGDGLTAVTAFSLDANDEATAVFRRSVAIGGAIILALVGVVLWILVGSLTRPITTITSAATRVANGELDTHIEAESRSSELSELANDLNRMLDRLRTTLERSEHSAAEATQARQDLERFLADMAHELRTPLTALKGYSDLYAGGMLETRSDVDRAMARIGSESERLYRLADEMLQLARSDRETDPIELVDVGEIAGFVATDLQAAYPDQRVGVEFTCSTPPVVLGSPARIHQAILNLGANACEHSTPHDEIELRVDRTATRVRLMVVDHGPGIPSPERDRVLLPFYRADPSRRRNGQVGAGLGLALVRKIVVQHGGDLSIEETEGGGATLIVLLPAADG